VQLSVLGLYLPPVFKKLLGPVNPPPDDHFTAGPDRRVIASCVGRIGRAGGCPTVRAGIVSPARVQREAILIKSAPDDHFAAIPNRGVTGSGVGRIGGAGGCPTVRAGIVSAAGPGWNVPLSAGWRVGVGGGCLSVRQWVVQWP